MGVLYSCTTFLGMFNMMSVMPILGYERSVMYRSAEAFPACPNTDILHVLLGCQQLVLGTLTVHRQILFSWADVVFDIK